MATNQPIRKMTRKTTDLLIVVLLCLVALTLIAWFWWSKAGLATSSRIPDVAMQTLDGKPFVFSQTKGKVKLVEFIYTRCPDICPTTTVKMVELQNILKQKGMFGNPVEFVTITIDPQHDTPELLRAYADNLKADTKGWTFVRGTEAETKKLTEAFKFYSEPLDSGLLSHSSTTYLLDQQNQVQKTFGMGIGLDANEVLTSLEELVVKGAQKAAADVQTFDASTPLAVTLQVTPSTPTAGEPVSFAVDVRQGTEMVDDADEVKLEVWKQGSDDHLFLEPTLMSPGLYRLDKAFAEPGTYYVMYHVTAREFHSMDKQMFTVAAK